MTEIATHDTGSRRVASASVVPGTTWFAAMVAMWSAFVTLLAASPETLDDVYGWLTGLAFVWEIVMWIALLPWALAYVVWESSWDDWLRVLIVALIAAAHLLLSAPKRWGPARVKERRSDRPLG